MYNSRKSSLNVQIHTFAPFTDNKYPIIIVLLLLLLYNMEYFMRYTFFMWYMLYGV